MSLQAQKTYQQQLLAEIEDPKLAFAILPADYEYVGKADITLAYIKMMTEKQSVEFQKSHPQFKIVRQETN